MMRSSDPGPIRNPSAVTAGTPMAGTSVRTMPKIATSAAPLRVNSHAETTTNWARSTVRTPASAICVLRTAPFDHTANVAAARRCSRCHVRLLGAPLLGRW